MHRFIWTATGENVPSDMYAQRRLKSACSSAQSDQSLRCPHEETLHPWRTKLCLVKFNQTARKLIWIFAGRTFPKGRFLSLRFMFCTFSLRNMKNYLSYWSSLLARCWTQTIILHLGDSIQVLCDDIEMTLLRRCMFTWTGQRRQLNLLLFVRFHISFCSHV